MLDHATLLLGVNTDLWYALPLVVVVSLVYSATRFERGDQIVAGAVRTGTWICGFMVVIFAVLSVLAWRT